MRNKGLNQIPAGFLKGFGSAKVGCVGLRVFSATKPRSRTNCTERSTNLSDYSERVGASLFLFLKLSMCRYIQNLNESNNCESKGALTNAEGACNIGEYKAKRDEAG
jgi:hypothetical protein